MTAPSGARGPVSLSGRDLERLLALSGLNLDLEALSRLPEAQRLVVAEELQALERLFRENPLLGFRPHGKQATFLGPPHPKIRLFLGGNRSGKTTSGMAYGILQSIDRSVVPAHLAGFKRWDPPCFGRVVTPNLTGTMEGVVLQKIREWCPEGQLHGGSVGRAFEKQQRMLRFKNGSWIQFMSNDQDLDIFGGAALHWVLYDEEPRQDIFKECRMRLIDYGGESLFTMTPLQGMSWVFDEYFEPWERGVLDSSKVRIVVVDMDDNPHLDEEAKEEALEGLTAEEREARKGGRFVSFAGLIYHEFDRSKHIVPELAALPDGVEVFVGIDAGLRWPAVVYAYLDEDDRMVVFDEIAPENVTIRTVCKRIQERNARWGVRPHWYVIDPSARNKNSQTGRSDQDEYASNGVPTIPGQNDVLTGINKVKQRLENDRLVVCAPCDTLLGEFKKYRWKAQPARAESDSREGPVKRSDHCLDALRYVCMQRPLAPDHDRPKDHEPYERRALRAHLKRLGSIGSRRTVDTGFGPGQFH